MKVMTSRIPQFIGAGLVGLGLSFGLSGAVQADHHGMKADIVDTAVEAGQFETLVAAVKAANLVETLKGEGPFTVFAPIFLAKRMT